MDSNDVSDRGGCRVLTKAGLGLGGDASFKTFNTANVINFTVDGVFNAKAILNNVAFSSGHSALAAGCACLFAVWVSLTGTVSTTQGKVVATADLSAGTGKTAIPMPDVIASNALIGLIKVVTAGAATFTPNTTALNATNVTATYYDTSQMPTVPLVTA